MKVTLETDRFEMLKEAVESGCDRVRFGSEFCEWKIPNLDVLREAYNLAKSRKKEFTYVTSRVSNSGLEMIRRQLSFLDGKERVGLVINDMGLLNILRQYRNLRPRLGRQLVYIPARCPWPQITGSSKVGFLSKRRVGKVFYQTGMNYKPTIRFFQSFGIEGVDVDWIPRCFQYFDFLIKNGLKLAVYLYLVPATITRRCHTARFLDETNPDSCSKPCNAGAFLLKQDVLETELFLQGNVVFRLEQPSQREIKRLCKLGVDEFVIMMNPITKVESLREIEMAIQRLNPY